MMELGSYPFSERYGWIQDRYGVSWQLMYGQRQGITPVMMFTGSVDGKCEEAIRFYTSVFHHSSAGEMMHGPNGTVQFGQFTLEGQSFAAMDGQGQPHKFRFNEAISLIVHCDDQQEIDYYWERLSADPKAEQCGWLKDRYGVSWQVTPRAMERMLGEGTPEQIDRVTKAFLPMKKFDLAKLEDAFRG
jgi:predicted 3-demethylubiquinone-9 3-methyltransferase (glyoxalase superfamily)